MNSFCELKGSSPIVWMRYWQRHDLIFNGKSEAQMMSTLLDVAEEAQVAFE